MRIRRNRALQESMGAGPWSEMSVADAWRKEWKGKGAPNRLHDFEAAKAASRELMKRERCALPPISKISDIDP
jgi:hypothetical protein